jgi:outer membrane protein, heavy metal efflux system
MPMKLLLGVLVVAVMAGCATFQPKSLSPSQTAAAFEARTLDDPSLKQFIEGNLPREPVLWPPTSWDFRMLTLVAFYYHPDLDVARATWGVARAGVITAGARPNPSVGFIPTFVSNAASGISPWILDFTFDIPIETAGKRGYRMAQATQLSEAAHLQIAAVAWQVRSRLRTRLLDLYAAHQAEALWQQQQAVQEEIVKLLERRFAVGESSQPEVTQAHLALDQSRLALRAQQQQGAEGRVRLAEVLGIPVGALDGVEISFDLVERPPMARNLPSPEVQRQALLNRLDIVRALAAYAASQSDLQLELAKQYPDIHLGPGYTFEQGDHRWSVGFSMVLPVLNRHQGPIAEAEARRTEAAARFSALQAHVIGELERALAGYHAALHTLETADAVLSGRKRAQQSTQALFQAGEADRLALVSAQLEIDASALARLDALVKAQQALGLLEDAIQRPLDPWEAFPVPLDTAPRPTEADNR